MFAWISEMRRNLRKLEIASRHFISNLREDTVNANPIKSKVKRADFQEWMKQWRTVLERWNDLRLVPDEMHRTWKKNLSSALIMNLWPCGINHKTSNRSNNKMYALIKDYQKKKTKLKELKNSLKLKSERIISWWHQHQLSQSVDNVYWWKCTAAQSVLIKSAKNTIWLN